MEKLYTPQELAVAKRRLLRARLVLTIGLVVSLIATIIILAFDLTTSNLSVWVYWVGVFWAMTVVMCGSLLTIIKRRLDANAAQHQQLNSW